MAEVLAKTEKYIKGEEALLSKQRSSSTQNEKSRGDKKRERSPRRQADRDRSPMRNRENRERSPKRRGNVRDRLGPPQPKLQQRYSPRQYTPLTASVSQVLSHPVSLSERHIRIVFGAQDCLLGLSLTGSFSELNLYLWLYKQFL